MKKFFIVSTALFLSGSLVVTAQDKKEKKSDDKVKGEQHVIIRKKDGEKATIVIDGDKVTINGKPADEWKDGDVEVLNDINPRIRIEGSPRIVIPRGNMKMKMWGDEDEKGGKLGVYMKDNDKGAEVTEVQENSSASKAGLQKGDIITKVGDKKVDDAESLTDAVRKHKAGEEVTVTYLRDGKEKSTKAKLDKRKGGFEWNHDFGPEMKEFNMDLAPLEGLRNMPFEDFGHNFMWRGGGGNHKLGIKIQDLEESDGVKITEVEDSSIAAKAGLKKDDVLLEVAGDKIEDTNDAREAIWDNWEKGSFTIKVNRNGSPMNIEVKIPKKIKSADL
ncbi:MAG: PDZ domain-containing protein [Sphingobacteriales bacterium]|nr:PDZ domain-containing protein [Sphingobacteriales bacterium]